MFFERNCEGIDEKPKNFRRFPSGVQVSRQSRRKVLNLTNFQTQTTEVEVAQAACFEK